MDTRDKIIAEHLWEVNRESALSKRDGGFILQPENVNAAFAKFVSGYDLYFAFWDEGGTDKALVIRAAGTWSDGVRSLKDGDLRGNAVWVQDRATAVALHTLCRSSDNVALAPPEMRRERLS